MQTSLLPFPAPTVRDCWPADEAGTREPSPDAADDACTRDEIVSLAAAIDTLPARCREIIILRNLHGISQKEIAARLRISEQAVQREILRGVRHVEAYFSRHLS